MSDIIEIKSIDELNKLMDNEDLLILYFDTKFWGVGKAVFPKLEDLADKYSVKILLIDIDKLLLVRGQLGVFSPPTILVMKEKKEILRESGFIKFENVERMLENLK